MTKQFHRASGLGLALVLLISTVRLPLTAAVEEEIPTRMFTGSEQAPAILANLNFSDVRASKSFAKEAIWETGALELMKGYGASRFGLADTLSVEQALAIAYVAAGREAEAQQAAETLDAARAANLKLFPAPRMWSDGYIQLAFNDGLLTQAQYADALQTDQLVLTGANFLRQSSVTREDMAYYLAGVLALAPLYPQTRMFNSFSDWRTANPVRIPAMEAILQNRLMHGDDTGRFRPKGFLTRAEAAQILQNAEPVIFPLLGYTKHKGRIEEVLLSEDWTSGVLVRVRTVRIRNSDGTLHTLVLREPTSNLAPNRNEQSGREVLRASDTIVSLGGVPQSGRALSKNQQIAYVSDVLNRIPYVRVLPATESRIWLGRIVTLDDTTREMTFQPYQELPFADLRLVDQATIQRMSTSTQTVRHIVSTGARIYSGEVQMSLAAIEDDTHAILVVEGGLVTYIEPVNLDILQQDGVVAGIVADANASLGYITLYAADGSGVSSGLANGFAGLRNYAYGPDPVVRRDGKVIPPEAIRPGDSVFLKLNPQGEVTEIGAASDYTALYGTVRNKGTSTVTLQMEDRSTKTWPLTPEVPVYRNGLPANRSDVVVGDRIRMLVQINGASTVVGEVRLERDPIPVSAIYRSSYVWYDPLNERVTVTGAQTFTGGRWLPANQSGALSFSLATDFEGSPPPERAMGTAYFVVREDLGGVERVTALTLREPSRFEQVYDDTIATTSTDGSRLSLMGAATGMQTDDGTLVVKDGRLVEAAAVQPDMRARVSAGRDGATGSMLVDVLIAETPTGADGLFVYRGRIRSIAEGSAVTLESFARLDGSTWTFFNTPTTFALRPDQTRLLANGGVAGLRSLTEADFKGTSVYVLTDGTYAASISDALYGETILKGCVLSVDGGTRDELGNEVTAPVALTLADTRRYDPLTYTWVAVPGGSVNIPGDVIVVRKGLQSTLSEIQPGDAVRVVQTEADGDARVVLADGEGT